MHAGPTLLSAILNLSLVSSSIMFIHYSSKSRPFLLVLSLVHFSSKDWPYLPLRILCIVQCICRLVIALSDDLPSESSISLNSNVELMIEAFIEFIMISKTKKRKKYVTLGKLKRKGGSTW